MKSVAIKRIRTYRYLLLIVCLTCLFCNGSAWLSAQPIQIPEVNLNIGGEADTPESLSTALQLLIALTVLTLAPAILVLITSFTRIVVY